MSLKSNQVAILGRPNVGKSTLFNLLTRKRKAVVKNESGVTRDIQIEPAEWWGKQFDVVDTGGLTEADDAFSKLIREQVVSLVKHFDLLVLVMDGKTGLVPEDRDIIRIANESGVPYTIVVNKVDQMHKSDLVLSEFYEFGEELIPTSFEKRDNVDTLIEWILANLKEDDSNTQREGLRVSIVGKPNVGKSSMCNRLLNKKRMLVSDIAGTTVDAIEDEIVFNDKKYILVDTAGMRKSAKRDDGVEFISSIKSPQSIDKSDLILLMVDSQTGPTHQDAKVVEYVLDKHKAVIMVANKADLSKAHIPEFRKKFREKAAETFHFFKDIPIVFTSAETGSGIDKLFETVEDIWEKLNIKIPTSQLNKFFYDVIRQAPSPVYGTKNVKFYYITQTGQLPPSFIAFANQPAGVLPSYRRFVTNRIRDKWDLKGIPIRLFVLKKGGK